MLLRLPDREVPLEPETADQLQKWRFRCERYSPYVAVSPRLRKRLVTQSMNSMARNALDHYGMPEVALKDLRYDFIRRQLIARGWTYALRVSGLSVETYRMKLLPLFGDQLGEPQADAPAPGSDSEYRLWRVLQKTRDTPAGIALWLLYQQGMQIEQIVRLTWGDVDFDREEIRLEEHSEPMSRGVSRVLADELARRAPEDDPHVLLSPRSRKPMDPRRMSVVLRTALIRGGIEDLTARDIRNGAAREVEESLIMDRIAKNGEIGVKEVSGMFHIPDERARQRLRALTDSGRLTRVGTRYYAAERVPPPAQQEALILQALADRDSIHCRDAADLLGLPARQAGRVLRRMVQQGKIRLIPGANRYVLPAEETNYGAETILVLDNVNS